MLSVKEIKEQLATCQSLDDDFVLALRSDERKGVQQALVSFERRIKKQVAQQEAFIKRSQFERKLWQEGKTYIAGVDEVGRGPLAGPVVTAAVILPPTCDLYELNDSKQLSEKKRELLYEKIMEEALAVSVASCSPAEIDEYNIYQATKKAMTKAIQHLKIAPDYVLLDAMHLENIHYPQESLIKGDARSISIAAASIIAKCTRDRLMKDYAKQYPAYDFEHNMGYGTKKHLTALEKEGITPIHRRSFEPIKSNYC